MHRHTREPRRTRVRRLALSIPSRQRYGETATGALWHAYDALDDGTLCRGHELVKATPHPPPMLSCSVCNGIVLRRLELSALTVQQLKGLPPHIRSRWNLSA